jgi:hypothetical protein
MQLEEYVDKPFKMINKPIEFTIKGEQRGWYPTSGTIIGYIVQTTVTDPGVSLSWYDSGSTPNVVLGVIASADRPLPKIHMVVHVEKLKVD